ncbi:MAG: hypothetical protein AMQ74_01043 [Candidatus Methanofastidiosum methylothiophilum]|uniref:Uncharacterized protein n=1 Tax=Candidatus Methanofastidiosum methylothiophilum TaxID=1705564 RepID=A0A150J3B0_9EURY|nr:MAG: hypothetical protein AMQ74_01043 [Candidatus Methanofastidiosum methylthiophilus]
MWDTLIKILSDKEYLFTLKEEKPFRIIDYSNKEILIQTTENKLRKIQRNEIEGPYNYIIKNGKISRSEIQELFSRYNPAYVASILSCHPDIDYQLNPNIELIKKNSLFTFDLKKEEIIIDFDKYDKRNFDKNGINRITGTKFDEYGYDVNWCDKNGFKWDGKHVDTDTYFNPEGYNREGYDKNGFNKNGINLITGKEKDIFGKYKKEYIISQNTENNFSDETNSILDKLTNVYKILYKLLLLPESDWKTKIYANAALSYFINPWDIIPESEKGKDGYLDDFYICLEILRDLKKYRSELINNIYPKYIKEDLDTFLEENINYCKRELKDKIFDIKKLVGYDSLDFFDLGNNQFIDSDSDKIYLRSKLLGAISFMFDELSSSTDSLCVNNFINDLSQSDEYFDILRIINKYNEKLDKKLVIDRENNYEEIFSNYEDKLNHISTGKRYGIIIGTALPIFKTLCNILKDKDCTWQIKHEINSVLSYFALNEDIIDDSLQSGLGYVDDVFLGTFVLYDILEKDMPLVNRNLSENIDSTKISYLLESTIVILESCQIDYAIGKIINLLGLKGLLTFYEIVCSNQNPSIFKNLLNKKLRVIFLDLCNLYFNNKLGIIDLPKNIESLIDYLLNNIPPEKTIKLNKFFEISLSISNFKNRKKEIQELEEKEELEAKAIMLKYKILSE